MARLSPYMASYNRIMRGMGMGYEISPEDILVKQPALVNSVSL